MVAGVRKLHVTLNVRYAKTSQVSQFLSYAVTKLLVVVPVSRGALVKEDHVHCAELQTPRV